LSASNELWAITVALPHEAGALRTHFHAVTKTRFRHMTLEEGRIGDRDALLVVTGMGPDRAAASARFLFEQYAVTHLISTGYCGALRGGLACGDAVVAERCAFLAEPQAGSLSDLPLLRRVEAALKQADIPIHLGTLITVAQPVLKSAEKELLGAKTGAIAVDMESAAVLRAAAESSKKIASVTVRFIVDALGDELVDTGSFLDENAAVKPLRLARELLRRPKLFQELPDLGRKAARARVSLTRFLGHCFGMGGT
jgi:adenosylhomocysteine nucleosidase